MKLCFHFVSCQIQFFNEFHSTNDCLKLSFRFFGNEQFWCKECIWMIKLFIIKKNLEVNIVLNFAIN